MLAVEIVSASIFGGTAQRGSANQQVSDDGRYVVFESTANDLVNGDNSAISVTNIFRRDLATGTTALVSVATVSTGANNSSSNAVISADGRYVAFQSTATNLVPGTDFNGAGSDLFLRDMVAGTTTLITRSAALNGTANQASARPSISDDGRFVAYHSMATDLVAFGLDNDTFTDIYLWDRTTLQNRLLSTAVGANTAANHNSANAVVSGDGSTVAFVSTSGNLVANDTNAGVQDVFTRPTVGGVTTLISVDTTGSFSGNFSSDSPSISDDGRFVAFTSNANNLVGSFIDINSTQDVFLRDRAANSTLLISIATTGVSGSSSSSNPVISGNGRYIAFTSLASNLTNTIDNGFQDVFARDVLTGTTLLVSAPAAGSFGANGISEQPVISVDGRYVAFSSTASNLVTNDINGSLPDVFRRDLTTGVNTLISVNVNGTGSGNGASANPVLSDSGQVVVFASLATNLVLNDNNQGAQDIFAFATSNANEFVVTGADQGGGPHVRVFDARNLALRYEFFPYNIGFRGGVRVATGDVNFDGVPDIITAAGPGGGPHIRVFNGAAPGQQLPGPIGSFFAYNTNFTGGVFIAAADIDGDGRADIITGADQGGGPHVRVFSGATGAVIRDFFAFHGSFTGGVRVAAADIDLDGVRDIVTAVGPGAGSFLRVYSGASGAIIREFAPYGGFRGGVYVSAGDANLDGRADIITGAGSTGGPHVRVFNGANNAEIVGFFAYAASFTGGVRVASVDNNGDGRVEILVAAGPGQLSNMRVYSTVNGALINQTTPYPGFFGGAFVAGTVPGSIGGSPLRAAGDPAATSPAAIDASVLEIVRSGAVKRFAALGLPPEELVVLQTASLALTDLPADDLGRAIGHQIFIDINAAGRGWFVDRTLDDDAEFSPLATAAPPGIDLLSVMAHELGHLLGWEDADHLLSANDLMATHLGPGERRLPTALMIDAVLAEL